MLPMLPHDKANHAVYGAAIASVGAIAHSWWAGAALCVIAAVAWEVYQLKTKGHPTPLDALASIGGGALIVLPLVI